MSYKLLLEVLPADVVALIYEFMKVNAANVIVAYFANAKRRHNVFVYLSHYSIEYISTNSIYSINSLYNANFTVWSNAKDKVIEDLYKHLVFMYGAHYSRTKYMRNGWANVRSSSSQFTPSVGITDAFRTTRRNSFTSGRSKKRSLLRT